MPESDKKLRIIITGGGTGGHIFPAIAVAQKLKLDSDLEKIFYIGCDKNMEKNIAASENLDFYSINVSGMPRKIGFKLASWFANLFFATIKSIYYMHKLKPDVVFGTGGYVSGPVLLAAKFSGIPFVIHDPDAHPGIVNKFMSKWAAAVSISFEQAKKHLKSKNINLNGNPIRANFSQVAKEEAIKELGLCPNKKTILVMGGSQGAKAVNNGIMRALPELLNMGFQIIHQTGAKNYESYIEELKQEFPKYYQTFVESATSGTNINITEDSQNTDNINKNLTSSSYIIKPFFNNMEIPLNAADIAISRAGSLSISELNLCGLPSILMPFPFAAADHQRFNARAMEEAGASLYMEDADCTAERLIALITEILNNPAKFEKMQNSNKLLAKPQATENIIKIIKNSASHTKKITV
jgi:UDP-N-acetylglucosamine--N-acetylmuramyl-(pentapeptide) pyrophosphoryl-undecaprenol N-acetylglucosamine transferase